MLNVCISHHKMVLKSWGFSIFYHTCESIHENITSPVGETKLVFNEINYTCCYELKRHILLSNIHLYQCLCCARMTSCPCISVSILRNLEYQEICTPVTVQFIPKINAPIRIWHKAMVDIFSKSYNIHLCHVYALCHVTDIFTRL